MDYIELACKISSENEQETRDILIAQLNEIGYESYDETEVGLNAYILEKFFDLSIVQNLQVNNIPDISIQYSHQIIKTQNWNEVWEKNFEPIIIVSEKKDKLELFDFNEKYIINAYYFAKDRH